MREVHMFVCDDGKQFENEEDAIRHEMKGDVKKALLLRVKDDVDCHSDDYDRRADAICKEEKVNIIMEYWDVITYIQDRISKGLTV